MKVEVGKEYNNVAEIFMIILMYMYFLLKPFYIMQSGGMQISDMFLAGAFICFLVYRFQTKNFKINKSNKVFIIFALWACVVNGVYFLIHRHFDFIKSSLWYIFIAMFLLIVTECYQRKDVLKKIYNIMNINIIVQFAIWAFQIGKKYGTIRYMGSFNDPNQYGFFIFMTILFLYTIEEILNLKPAYISYIIGLFLIYLSASTGSFIGVAIFLGLLVLINIKNIKKINFGFVKKIALKVKENRVPVTITSTFLICFIFTSSLFINEVYGGMRNVLMKDNFTRRIVEKVEKVERTGKEVINKAVHKIDEKKQEPNGQAQDDNL